MLLAVLGIALGQPRVAQGQGVDAQDDAEAEGMSTGDALLELFNEPWRGDWDGVRGERRVLRVLTTYNRTNFLIESGTGRGLEYEAMRDLEAWLNRRDAPGGSAGIRMVFVPVPREALIPALLEGRGDVIAAGMTVTPDRAAQLLFARPYIRDVAEVVVRHRDAAPIDLAEDLSGRAVMVTRGSSYLGSLRALDARLQAAGRAGIRVQEAPTHLETEDVLELVNAGLVAYGVADSHIAAAWDRVLPDIVVESGATIAVDGDIAWAVRPDAPLLKAILDDYVEQRLEGRPAGALSRFRRYFEGTRFLSNPFGLQARDRLRRLAPLFQREAEQVAFHWLMMLAQGYQESGLDPAARSPHGAVGIMQLLPETGRLMGARDLLDPADNIRAGIAYMEHLRTRYFDDAAIDPAERIYLVLAAYNAGPNRINRLRGIAARQGLDPDRWFGHVERVVQNHVGTETVRYVANIRAYFLTFVHALDLLNEREEDRAEIRALLEAARR
jgi:membrane-bound lytic murein transglycosylase MltF